MNDRPDVSKYWEGIETVKRAHAGDISPEYLLARILGPLYPLGTPTLRAIWAAEDLLKTDPDRAATLLAEHCIDAE